MNIETIHESLINGQRRQMVSQIDEYGVGEFWSDYARYLEGLYVEIKGVYEYFYDACTSYHRIKSR